MKRIKVAGFCLVAVFAFTAFAASSAFAGEYGHCVKVAKEGKIYKGHYTSKDCLQSSEVSKEEQEKGGKKDEYNWEPVKVGSSIKYTASGKQALLEAEAGTITCTHNTGEGEITGPKSGKDKVTFTGCSISLSKEECFSAGNKGKATIVSLDDESTLIDHGEKGPGGKEPAVGEVWNEVTGQEINGGVIAEFVCLAFGFEIPFSVNGSLSGIQASKYSNKAEKVGEFTAGKEKGEQDLTGTIFNPETKRVETNPVVQNVSAKTKIAEKVELRS